MTPKRRLLTLIFACLSVNNPFNTLRREQIAIFTVRGFRRQKHTFIHAIISTQLMSREEWFNYSPIARGVELISRFGSGPEQTADCVFEEDLEVWTTNRFILKQLDYSLRLLHVILTRPASSSTITWWKSWIHNLIVRIGLLNENTHDSLQLWVSCLRTHQAICLMSA